MGNYTIFRCLNILIGEAGKQEILEVLEQMFRKF